MVLGNGQVMQDEGTTGLFGDLPSAPIGWSVNKLARELRLDRRTVTKRLVGVSPLAEGPGGPVYALADAARALFGQTTASEQDELKSRTMRVKAELADIELAKSRSELVRVADVEKAAFMTSRAEREALLNWPDRAAPILAAELEIDQVRLATALERQVRAYLEERSDDA